MRQIPYLVGSQGTCPVCPPLNPALSRVNSLHALEGSRIVVHFTLHTDRSLVAVIGELVNITASFVGPSPRTHLRIMPLEQMQCETKCWINFSLSWSRNTAKRIKGALRLRFHLPHVSSQKIQRSLPPEQSSLWLAHSAKMGLTLRIGDQPCAQLQRKDQSVVKVELDSYIRGSDINFDPQGNPLKYRA